MKNYYFQPIVNYAVDSLERLVESNPLKLEAITLDLHTAFKVGARRIAKQEREYTDLHKAHGIEQAHWELLTQDEYWTPDEARAVRSILASVIEVSMTIAGMPPIPMPGQYAAALIAEVVAPCNWMLAAMKAPDTFDATDASGLVSTAEVKDMPPQQLMALVLAYGGGHTKEPNAHLVPKTVLETVEKENKATRRKALS